MIYFLLARTFAFLLDLLAIMWRSDHEKDLEILLLRQQLRILQRKHPHPPRLSRWDKLGLVVLTARLTAVNSQARARLSQIVLLFKPERRFNKVMQARDDGASSASWQCRSWLRYSSARPHSLC